MAKSNIRKTDSQDINAAQRRRKAPAGAAPAADAAAKPRLRRKTDEPTGEPIAVQTAAGPATALADVPVEGSVSVTASVFEITHEAIAERAYHIYLERGCTPGDPYEDWLAAERQLRERLVGV